MRDRLIKILENVKFKPFCQFNIMENQNTIIDVLLANGVIVPPCKVGKTVYRLVDGFNYPLEYEVTEIHIHFFTHIEVKEIGIKSKCGKFGDIIGFSDFGKTVFFTKEEAEQALKGGVEE